MCALVCGRVMDSPLDFALECQKVGDALVATLFVCNRLPGGARTSARTSRFAVADVLVEAVRAARRGTGGLLFERRFCRADAGRRWSATWP